MIEPRASTEIERMTRMMMRKWHNEITVRLKNNLSTAQYYMLESLREREHNCTELAEALNITLPAVTNLANKLVTGGYAERIQTGSDRRKVHLRITGLGHAALQDLDQRAAEMVGEMWEALTPEETNELSRLIRKALRLDAALHN